jgi:very-short-patch-repair endonuclease
MTRRDIDEAIATLAAGQDGVFSRRQARALGATTRLIERRVASGSWQPLAESVLMMRGTPHTWRSKMFTAVLAPAADAVVSHESAAELHGLPTFTAQAVAVTVPHADVRLADLAVFHQSRRLYPDHVTAISGLPVTTVARTIVDLAAACRRGRIEIVLDRAVAARKVTIAEFCTTFDDLACRGRKGIALLRAVLAERAPGYIPPASVAESRLLRVLRLGGLPRPVLQFAHPAPGFEGRRVDAAYPEQRILIEVDSRTWHGGWTDGERDRERDLAALAVDFRTIRVAYRTLVDSPEWIADQLRDVLRAAA